MTANFLRVASVFVLLLLTKKSQQEFQTRQFPDTQNTQQLRQLRQVLKIPETTFSERESRKTSLDASGNQINPNAPVTEVLRNMGLTIFPGLIERLGLEKILSSGDFTIFAPLDSAFALLPLATLKSVMVDGDKLKGVILNHVINNIVTKEKLGHEQTFETALPGGEHMLRSNVYKIASDPAVHTVNGVKIIKFNQRAQGAVIHLIDRVLFPPAKQSLIDMVFDCEFFETLSSGLILSGLLDVLDTPGPFTIFAPSKKAFDMLDDSASAQLRKNQTALKAGLLYHVVPGTYYSEGLRDRQYLSTALPGTDLQCGVTTDGFTKRLAWINDVRVIKPDIVATNGVMHIIDSVLRPDLEYNAVCKVF